MQIRRFKSHNHIKSFIENEFHYKHSISSNCYRIKERDRTEKPCIAQRQRKKLSGVAEITEQQLRNGRTCEKHCVPHFKACNNNKFKKKSCLFSIEKEKRGKKNLQFYMWNLVQLNLKQKQ